MGTLPIFFQPSKKAEQKVKDRITGLTKRDRTIMPLEWVVNETNAMLRGWVGYFHYRNCSQTLRRVRNHLEQRMTTHLRKRHKVRDRNTGYVRFPNRSLYEKYGLYKVPTSAGWTKASASFFWQKGEQGPGNGMVRRRTNPAQDLFKPG
jgi:hypothetical protein